MRLSSTMDPIFYPHDFLKTLNLEYEQWYEFLGQKSMVDALLSRLRHHCTTVRIPGAACLRPPED